MLDGLATLAYSEWVRIKALLHSIEQMLMLGEHRGGRQSLFHDQYNALGKRSSSTCMRN
jgi:hypothetical protein